MGETTANSDGLVDADVIEPGKKILLQRFKVCILFNFSLIWAISLKTIRKQAERNKSMSPFIRIGQKIAPFLYIVVSLRLRVCIHPLSHPYKER